MAIWVVEFSREEYKIRHSCEWSKIGHISENKAFKKLKVSKNAFQKHSVAF